MTIIAVAVALAVAVAVAVVIFLGRGGDDEENETESEAGLVAITSQGDLVEVSPENGDIVGTFLRGLVEADDPLAHQGTVSASAKEIWFDVRATATPALTAEDPDSPVLVRLDRDSGDLDDEGLGAWPALSPDGKRLAYVSDRGPVDRGPFAPTDVVVRDLQEGTETVWLAGDETARPAGPPRWSPDGAQLIVPVESDEDVSGLLLSEGREPRTVFRWDPGETPLRLAFLDAERIAVAETTTGPTAPVSVISLEGDDIEAADPARARYADRDVLFSADLDEPQGQILDLAVVPDGGDVYAIGRPDSSGAGGALWAWSAEKGATYLGGSYLAVSPLPAGPDPVPPESTTTATDPRRVPAGPTAPAGRLALVAMLDDGAIVSLSPETGIVEDQFLTGPENSHLGARPTDPDEPVPRITATPDGSAIWFDRWEFRPGEDTAAGWEIIELHPREGTRFRFGAGSHPAASPDGRSLARLNEPGTSDAHLLIDDLDGDHGPEQLVAADALAHDGIPPFLWGHPNWSPDGAAIVFPTSHGVGDYGLLQTTTDDEPPRIAWRQPDDATDTQAVFLDDRTVAVAGADSARPTAVVRVPLSEELAEWPPDDEAPLAPLDDVLVDIPAADGWIIDLDYDIESGQLLVVTAEPAPGLDFTKTTLWRWAEGGGLQQVASGITSVAWVRLPE